MSQFEQQSPDRSPSFTLAVGLGLVILSEVLLTAFNTVFLLPYGIGLAAFGYAAFLSFLDATDRKPRWANSRLVLWAGLGLGAICGLRFIMLMLA